jgi:hypothetical protein
MGDAAVEFSFVRINQFEGLHYRPCEKVLPFLILFRFNIAKFNLAEKCVIGVVKFLRCLPLRYFQLTRVVQNGLNVLLLLECRNFG